MKSRILILLFLLTGNFVVAQLPLQWVNNFCCFDSVAPHSFSYPLGTVVDQDTLIIAYYEDGFLNFKKIDLVAGGDFQNAIYTNDTVQPVFNFGGGMTMIAGRCVTTSVKYDGTTGSASLLTSSVWRDFSDDWSNNLSTVLGKVSEPVSNHTSSGFYSCIVSDSVYVQMQSTNGTQGWLSTVSSGHPSSQSTPQIVINSLFEVNVILTEDDSTHTSSSVRLISFEPVTGALVMDTVYATIAGDNHHFFSQINDTLKVAWLNSSGQISFADIALVTNDIVHSFNSGVSTFSGITKFSVDPYTHNYYVKTIDALLGFTSGDSLLFNISLPSEAEVVYDRGNILFDVHGNLITAFSVNNSLNNPPNSDLKIMVIDKISGSIIASDEYNDVRNTDDNFINNFMILGDYYILFANNFDNASILQEETQLGLLKYSILPVGIKSISDDNNGIAISPNPAHDKFRISGLDMKNSIVKIFNLSGNCVYESSPDKSNFEINLSGQASGMYFLRIQNEKGNILAKKIIIE